MYCRSCGSKLEDGKAFCGNCGTPVQPESAAKAPTETPAPADDAKKNRIGNRFCIISMLLLFIPSVIVIPLTFIRMMDYTITDPVILVMIVPYFLMVISSYALMIIARVKYPTKLSKVMMIVYCVLFALAVLIGAILLIFVVLADCGGQCVDCVHHF